MAFGPVRHNGRPVRHNVVPQGRFEIENSPRCKYAGVSRRGRTRRSQTKISLEAIKSAVGACGNRVFLEPVRVGATSEPTPADCAIVCDNKSDLAG